MAKSKQQKDKKEKLKKSKAALKSPKGVAGSAENACISLNRKQTELARVFSIKCAQLMQGNLTYLEYMELRDEINRLNALKEVFNIKAGGF